MLILYTQILIEKIIPILIQRGGFISAQKVWNVTIIWEQRCW